MAGYRHWLKGVQKVACSQGWAVTQGKHVKFKSPEGRVVCCACTPRNPFRVQKDILCDLRREGLDI